MAIDTDAILHYCDQIDTLVQQIRNECEIEPEPPEPPEETIINAGEDLQIALNAGGNLALAPDTAFLETGGYNFVIDGTSLTGKGNNVIAGDRGEALDFPLNYHNGQVADLHVEVHGGFEFIVRAGRNDSSQIDPAVAPSDIVFRNVTAGPHVGKRAFEIHGRNVTFENCAVYGVYDDAELDSQAIWIGNSPGGIRVIGGHFEAASENLMVGGDELKLEHNQGARPTDIHVIGAVFTKPLEWQTAGTPKVKNLFELKDGHNVLVKDCRLFHCWKSAQDGYAFVLTPRRGGSLRNVRIENCEAHDVGALFNITGVDSGWTVPGLPRTQVEILSGSFTTNLAQFPGAGRCILITSGPEYVRCHNAYFKHEGSCFLGVEDNAPVDQIHIIGCEWNYGSYGIRIGGYSHGDDQKHLIADFKVEGCTIYGAHSSFKTRFPNNTYVGTYTKKHRDPFELDTPAFLEELGIDVKAMRRD